MSKGQQEVGYKVLIGDCRDTLKTLPSQSINTCVTSPPYFGLRDYGDEAQMGAEPTPDEFVVALVEVFREVRRVLRGDGTVWLNLGDSYATGAKASRDVGTPSGLKTKDLIGIPWLVAFALRADGWYLRQDIIWHKPNPMPENVKDRCTKSHEYIFMFSKSPKYYYDYIAVREPAVMKPQRRNKRAKYTAPGAGEHRRGTQYLRGGIGLDSPDGKRNLRSVWTVPTKPYKGAHFATFPPALIKPCVLSGCPEGGTVLDPFGGSGTTAGVAVGSGRNAIICELNPEYVKLIPDRVEKLIKEAGEG